jgi:putative thioredoxin
MSNPNAVFDVDTAAFQASVLDASSRTPVLVDFWAAWCGPCKALTPVLERLAAQAGGRYVLAKVDTDANRELAAANGIRSLPTVRLFVNGQAVAEFMGAQPEAVVRQFLREHLPQHEDDALVAIGALLDEGALARARQDLDALEPQVRESAPALSLAARLEFLTMAGDAPPEQALRERVDGDPTDLDARFLLSVRHAAAARYTEAMDGFLAVLSRERGFRDDGARRALLQVFTVLGPGDPLVALYRGRLASTLN